jgi:hypothetical protein
MALTRIERARFRRDHVFHYAAWLIDAEGKTRKFYALSEDEAFAQAKAAGLRKIAHARVAGVSAPRTASPSPRGRRLQHQPGALIRAKGAACPSGGDAATDEPKPK